MAWERKWTDEMNAEFIRLYPDTDNSVLERLFNRSNNCIRNHAKILGVKKTKAYRRNQNKATQFQIGGTPHNKGLKMSEYCSSEAIARCTEKRYKKGNIPHTTLPLGTERVRKDNGFTEVKVKSEGRYHRERWRLKHHIVWEEHNGPIPQNCIVIFKDGDKTNFEISNLELRTRSEQCYLNMDDVPIEIKRLEQLQSYISRQIKNTSKTKEK